MQRRARVPTTLAADLGVKLLHALPPSLSGAERLEVPIAASPSRARQDQIQSLCRLVADDEVKQEPLEIRKELLLAAPGPLCPRRQSQAVAAWDQKLPRMDLEEQSISGRDGLVGANNKPNIHLTVPPAGEDTGVPSPRQTFGAGLGGWQCGSCWVLPNFPPHPDPKCSVKQPVIPVGLKDAWSAFTRGGGKLFCPSCVLGQGVSSSPTFELRPCPAGGPEEDIPPPTAPVPCSSPKVANKILLEGMERGSPSTDPVLLGNWRWPQAMPRTGSRLHFWADGELGAAWLGPGLRAGLLFGLEVRKAWPRLWQQLMLYIPSAVPSSSPALSLFLTSSGNRATRQRDLVPAPDSWTHRNELAARLGTRPGMLEPPKSLGLDEKVPSKKEGGLASLNRSPWEMCPPDSLSPDQAFCNPFL